MDVHIDYKLLKLHVKMDAYIDKILDTFHTY